MKKEKSIKLTDEQYKALVKLLFYGEWVLSANKVGADIENKESRDLLEYIFSHKENFSLKVLV